MQRHALYLILVTAALLGCNRNADKKDDQQIRMQASADSNATDTSGLSGTAGWAQLASTPRTVLLTGMPQHRLVTVYRQRKLGGGGGVLSRANEYYSSARSKRYTYTADDHIEHYMPGLDLQYGYHLLNVSHYDMQQRSLRPLFAQPVLIRTLYYPSYNPDSLHKKPISRNYYLVSVYDADTNQDTLLNKRDLRRFYYFTADAQQRIALLPPDHSAERSEYDPGNDVMYIYARHDANKNGTAERTEPLHIYWLDLKNPVVATRLY